MSMNKDLEIWLISELVKRGLSNNQFSKIIGIDHSNFSRMLSGERGLTVPFLVETSKLLGVSVDWLLNLEGELPSVTGDDLTNIYNKLPPDKKQEVIDFAEFLLHKQSQEKPQDERQDATTT